MSSSEGCSTTRRASGQLPRQQKMNSHGRRWGGGRYHAPPIKSPIPLKFQRPSSKLIYPVKTIQILCSASDDPKRDPAEDIQITDYIDAGVNGQSCPLFRKYQCKDFILVNFDFRYPQTKVTNILNRGILLPEEGHYIYFGQSASQLRARKCILYNTNLGEFAKIIQSFGDFNVLPSISKRAARIGLLLSSATPSTELVDEDISYVDDIIDNSYTFTDGCGFISLELAKAITEKMMIGWRYKGQTEEVPSVFQVRLKGCKGTLMLDSENKTTRFVKIRPSMEKFKWNLEPPHILALVDGRFGVSRPNTFGKLNKQYIRLLSGLGIRDEIFLNKQEIYFEELKKLPEDESLQIKYLCALGYHDFAEKVMEENINSNVKRMIRKISTQASRVPSHYDNKKKTPAARLIIPIEKSRNVYGICDPTNQLQYGQCFFQPTIRGSPQPLNVKIVVAKNPCYHPGDIRILECVDVKECRHLVDCLVFPVKGERPHSDEIAGSDLDGDLYFVCWDPELIPEKTVPPTSYKEWQLAKMVTKQTLLSYFANYKSATISSLNRLYERWVDVKGIFSDECLEIADLFNQAIDTAKTGKMVKIPHHLQQQPSPHDDSIYVWQKLLDEANKYLIDVMDGIIKTNGNGMDAFSEQDMMELVSDKENPLSDLQVFRLVLIWCRRRCDVDPDFDLTWFLHFTKHVNFSRLLPNERTVADVDIISNIEHYFEQLPEEYVKELMKQVENALYQSELLDTEDIEMLTGKESYRWMPYYRMYPGESFPWPVLHEVMGEDVRKLLVFRIQVGRQDWILACTIDGTYRCNQDPVKIDTIHFQASVFTSRHASCKDPRKMVSLVDGYEVELLQQRLDIYLENKGKTFISLQEDEGEQETTLSVALNRFGQSFMQSNDDSRIRKQYVVAFEIFKISPQPHFDHKPYHQIE